jgi:pimeloyl-ACP methyl ester carboxylesterase
VADIAGLIGALDLGPVHVCGFSYVGLLGQALALEHPGRRSAGRRSTDPELAALFATAARRIVMKPGVHLPLVFRSFGVGVAWRCERRKHRRCCIRLG